MCLGCWMRRRTQSRLKYSTDLGNSNPAIPSNCRCAGCAGRAHALEFSIVPDRACLSDRAENLMCVIYFLVQIRRPQSHNSHHSTGISYTFILHCHYTSTRCANPSSRAHECFKLSAAANKHDSMRLPSRDKFCRLRH